MPPRSHCRPMYSVNFADQTATTSAVRNFPVVFAVLSDVSTVVWIVVVLLSDNFEWRTKPSLVAFAIVVVFWIVSIVVLLVKRGALSPRQKRNDIIGLVVTAVFMAVTFGSLAMLHKLDIQNLNQEQVKCKDKINEVGITVSECE